MILEALTKDLPPMLKVLFAGVQAMIPLEVMQGIDQYLAQIASDLAHGRDQRACEKMRALLTHLGIDLNDYRDHDSSE